VKDSEPDYKKFNKENQIIELTVSEIISEVKKYNCKNIVLTGGEPMVQQKDLIGLISEMKNADPEYFFEIETNGTIKPNDEFEKLIDQYNVSPKLENSAVKKDEREKPEVLSFFSGNMKSNFKFVISKKEDSNEILSIVEKYDISPEKVFLMPEGTTKKDLIQKRKELIELCKKYSFNFTDRLHIHVFGNKRGV
jgi:organic radical activating enzyme